MYRGGGGRGGNNPFDDDDDGGFGGGSRDARRGGNDGFGGGGGAARGSDRGFGGGARGGYGSGGRDDVYGGGGYGGGYNSRPSERDPVDDYESRYVMANKRMEESSASSLRTLNETMKMGIDTTEELERQAESLDRTERRLDEMHVDLDKGERNLRKIKSPFGGITNYFSRRKTVDEVTDPKGFKPTQTKGAAKSKPGPANKKQQSYADASTGNTVVDDNLEEMGKALFQLKGIGEVMGTQLDDSEQQIDRVKYKIDRDHVKMDKLNKGIKRELYK